MGKNVGAPPYSPDLAPANFYLFPKLKKQPAGNFLEAPIFKKEWDGVSSTIPKDAFATAR